MAIVLLVSKTGPTSHVAFHPSLKCTSELDPLIVAVVWRKKEAARYTRDRELTIAGRRGGAMKTSTIKSTAGPEIVSASEEAVIRSRQVIECRKSRTAMIAMSSR